jgi:hypothetical protein
MKTVYSRAAIVVVSAYLFSGLVPRALRRISNSGKTWNSSNSISKSTSSGANRNKISCSSS